MGSLTRNYHYKTHLFKAPKQGGSIIFGGFRCYVGLVFSFPKCINISRCDQWLTRYDVPKWRKFGIFQKFKRITFDIGFCIYSTILMILGCFGPKRCSKFMSCGDCSKKVKIDLIYCATRYDC